MFIFILQLRHMLEGHPELYLVRDLFGADLVPVAGQDRPLQGYRPFTGRYFGSTSVIVPVVDEPETCSAKSCAEW